MRAASAAALLVVSTLAAGAVALVSSTPAAPTPTTPTATRAPARAAPPMASTLRDEALTLYAAGDLPTACDRFSRAAASEPGSPARREDAAGCFEAWAWRMLRENRPDEAIVLFAQGLRERPGTPALFRGLGIAAIHAGRLDEALAPLELAAAATGEADVRLVLARLYDQRDDSVAAVRHLRAVLAREPQHSPAAALLGKIERERWAEADFRRTTTARFLVKWRGEDGTEPPRAVLRALEIAHARLDTQLGYRPSGRVSVVLYGDRQFRDTTRAHGLVNGLFDGKIRLPAGPAAPTGAALERLIIHEYVHAAVHDLSRGRAPRWLHEGLAQLFEGATPDATPGVRAPATLTELEGLLADVDPARARIGYDVALRIVDDLAARGGMASLRALLARIAGGESASVALPRVYGPGLSELEWQWRHLLGT